MVFKFAIVSSLKRKVDGFNEVYLKIMDAVHGGSSGANTLSTSLGFDQCKCMINKPFHTDSIEDVHLNCHEACQEFDEDSSGVIA